MTGLALLVRQRIWQVPILAMLAVTFIGTLLIQIFTFIFQSIVGTPLPFLESVNLIILPSMLLNLILAIPVFAIVKDFSEWLYPEEIDI